MRREVRSGSGEDRGEQEAALAVALEELVPVRLHEVPRYVPFATYAGEEEKNTQSQKKKKTANRVLSRRGGMYLPKGLQATEPTGNIRS